MPRPPLEYGRANAEFTRKSWVTRAAVTVAVLLFLCLAASLVSVCHSHDTMRCRICGRTEDRHRWYVAGIPVRSRTVSASGEYDRIYDRLIGTSHQHQWFRAYYAGDRGNPFGYSGTGEGGPYPPELAVRESLEEMQSCFAELPPIEREHVYAKFQQCTTAEDVRRVVHAEALLHGIPPPY